MLIANPIYEAVFKYLLDDNQVARLLIGSILDIPIENLHLEPSETSFKPAGKDFSIFRIDFKATITTENGQKQVILIEIQKAKHESEIMRFRKYLGSQYMDTKNVYDDKSRKAIPIQTIYFLGTTLKNLNETPILKVTRAYIDVYNSNKIEKKEDFIECLTHDSVIIQIPLFKVYRRNSIERLLSIFEASTRHEIDVPEDEDAKFSPIIRRLLAANVDEKLRTQMAVEDEILQEIADKDFAIAQLELEKEEERKQKEEALIMIKNIINLWLAEGLDTKEIAQKLGKTILEIENIIA
jgi:hypothetical protein